MTPVFRPSLQSLIRKADEVCRSFVQRSAMVPDAPYDFILFRGGRWVYRKSEDTEFAHHGRIFDTVTFKETEDEFEVRVAKEAQAHAAHVEKMAAAGVSPSFPLLQIVVRFVHWTHEMADAAAEEYRRLNPDRYPQPQLEAPRSLASAPAPTGMLALSGPQQPAADTDQHDDDFAEDTVVVGDNPPVPGTVTSRPRSGLRVYEMHQRTFAGATDIDPRIYNGGVPSAHHLIEQVGAATDLAQAHQQRIQSIPSF